MSPVLSPNHIGMVSLSFRELHKDAVRLSSQNYGLKNWLAGIPIPNYVSLRLIWSCLFPSNLMGTDF